MKLQEGSRYSVLVNNSQPLHAHVGTMRDWFLCITRSLLFEIRKCLLCLQEPITRFLNIKSKIIPVAGVDLMVFFYFVDFPTSSETSQ